MNSLSVAIITKNEEKNISRCLNSVTWVDEIVVVDSGSQDRTKDICLEFNCKFYERDWQGYGETKQIAVDLCTNGWVLVLDADEVVTEELQRSIKNILQDPQFLGYKIKRNSFYLGQRIEHCGWGKDYPLRLFKKDQGGFNDKIVHESIEIEGPIGKIEQPMQHFTYPTIEEHINKMTKYAKLGASQSDKKTGRLSKAIFSGIFKFIKMYFLKLGFLDGKKGFLLCINSAFGVYLKYIYIWESNESR